MVARSAARYSAAFRAVSLRGEALLRACLKQVSASEILASFNAATPGHEAHPAVAVVEGGGPAVGGKARLGAPPA